MSEEQTDGEVHDPRNEDRAVGIELQAIELSNQLEWAESQGREDDAQELRLRLEGLYEEMAALAVQPPWDGEDPDDVEINTGP
ncbi:hypothetical protein BH20ACT2_BH20ACT2_00140 [soil metagenome]